MKKLIISAFLFYVSFFILSCSKNSENLSNKQLDPPTMSLTSNTKEVLLMESYYEIRQGYSLLKSEEKENLWLMKYNTILNNDKETLTEFQKEIIKDLKNFTSVLML